METGLSGLRGASLDNTVYMFGEDLLSSQSSINLQSPSQEVKPVTTRPSTGSGGSMLGTRLGREREPCSTGGSTTRSLWSESRISVMRRKLRKKYLYQRKKTRLQYQITVNNFVESAIEIKTGN